MAATKKTDDLHEEEKKPTEVLVELIDVNTKGWETVCRASSPEEGWVRTTRRLQVNGGHLYQTETQQLTADGDRFSSQALVFVPAVR